MEFFIYAEYIIYSWRIQTASHPYIPAHVILRENGWLRNPTGVFNGADA